MNEKLLEEIRQKSTAGLKWPAGFDMLTLMANRGKMRQSVEKTCRALKVNAGESLVIGLLSTEYIEVGKLWIEHVSRCQVNYLIAATDQPTIDFLLQNNLPHIDATVMTDCIEKWLAVTSVKFQVAMALIKLGIDVVMCDIDALPLRHPRELLVHGADISFQRTMHFPRPLAEEWGFAACTGFVSFKASVAVEKFLALVLKKHRWDTCDDQVAFNLALIESEIEWHCNIAAQAADATLRQQRFIAAADRHFLGNIRKFSLTVNALPADTCWRHLFIKPDLAKVVILHPNSARSQNDKLVVISKCLNGKQVKV